MISRLFIANRGEIACRIARSARRMGIKVYGLIAKNDGARGTLELFDGYQEVDENKGISPYLNSELLIRLAKKFSCDAIHPGYGFLSENPQFAANVAGAGLIWVGPNAEAISAMADKVRAKEIMSSLGLSILPSWCSDGPLNPESCLTAARQIGYPLLIKAAFGGGGRGMRPFGVRGASKKLT